MLHRPKRRREGESKGETQHERARAGTRARCKLVFVWASAVPTIRTTTAATRAFTLASFTTLLCTHKHCQTACRQKSSLPNLLLLLLCALALSCSLSRMHCVKLAPLIVVAAVHFNALFRTPFPLSPSSLCFCRCNLNEAFN